MFLIDCYFCFCNTNVLRVFWCKPCVIKSRINEYLVYTVEAGNQIMRTYPRILLGIIHQPGERTWEIISLIPDEKWLWQSVLRRYEVWCCSSKYRNCVSCEQVVTSIHLRSLECIAVGNKANGYSTKVNMRDVCWLSAIE